MVVTAGTGVIVVVVVIEPITVATIWVFQPHDVTILQRGSINSVTGEDPESEPHIVKPVVSRNRAELPVKMYKNRLV